MTFYNYPKLELKRFQLDPIILALPPLQLDSDPTISKYVSYYGYGNGTLSKIEHAVSCLGQVGFDVERD
jgi:hypothetical protein